MAKNNKPQTVLRDGNLKATLWANDSVNGPYISVTLAKTYDDNGTPRDTGSFSGTDLLRISELSREAYRLSNKLRRDLNEAASDDHDEVEAEEPAPKTTRKASAKRTQVREHRL